MMDDTLDEILANPLTDSGIFPTSTESKKHSVRIGKRKTSVFINDEFWNGLKLIAQDRACSVNQIVKETYEHSPHNLSLALRSLVIQDRKSKTRRQ